MSFTSCLVDGASKSGKRLHPNMSEKTLRYVLSAVIVALVVDALDAVDRRAAVTLSVVIVLLILIANADKVSALAGR